MQTTMMDVPLSLNHLLERAGTIFAGNEIVSRLPDKIAACDTRYGEFHRRTRALASALQGLGLQQGRARRHAGWNHHAHLECYFGIPAAGGVMHTLNLRLAPDEIGWIAADADDRFIVVDDILLPLYRQFAHLHRFERVIVFPFSGAPVPAELRRLRAAARRRRRRRPSPTRRTTRTTRCRCATRPAPPGSAKGVVYSHRSTVLHTLVGCLGDHLGLQGHRRAAAGDADVPRQLPGACPTRR